MEAATLELLCHPRGYHLALTIQGLQSLFHGITCCMEHTANFLCSVAPAVPSRATNPALPPCHVLSVPGHKVQGLPSPPTPPTCQQCVHLGLHLHHLLVLRHRAVLVAGEPAGVSQVGGVGELSGARTLGRAGGGLRIGRGKWVTLGEE